MNKELWKVTMSAACLAAMLGAAESAKAISFNLDQANAALPGGGPYVKVDVTLNANQIDATIVFTGLSAGGFNYAMGAQGAVGINVNGLANVMVTIGGSTGHPGGSAYTLSPGGAGNEDGWGSFNYTIDNTDGFNDSAISITLNLHRTSGTWASDADVLTANASGHLAAAHIHTGDANWDAVPGGLTGYATDGGGGHNVPDGGTTLSLAGIGLAALGLLRRKLS